jgi:hypothetical protein
MRNNFALFRHTTPRSFKISELVALWVAFIENNLFTTRMVKVLQYSKKHLHTQSDVKLQTFFEPNLVPFPCICWSVVTSCCFWTSYLGSWNFWVQFFMTDFYLIWVQFSIGYNCFPQSTTDMTKLLLVLDPRTNLTKWMSLASSAKFCER